MAYEGRDAIVHIKGAAALGLALLVITVSGCSYEPEPAIDQYFAQLDEWVEAGAPVDKIQTDVVVPCGKMLMAYSPASDKALFVTTGGDDFDFWVDMCVKMTAHRVSPQPEFERAEIADIIESTCNSHEMWRRLCDSAKLGL